MGQVQAFSRDPCEKVRSNIFNTVYAQIPFTSIQLHMTLVQSALNVQRTLLTLLTLRPGYGPGTKSLPKFQQIFWAKFVANILGKNVRMNFGPHFWV